MRAVVLRSHGGPDVLGIEDVPDPVGGPEDIVVDIRATALNRADLLQRMGFYPNPFPEALEIPGMEFGGTVRSVGERVRLWQPGDHVMGIVAGGAYAERIAVHERQVMAVPTAVGLDDAAAIPEVFLTAWDALVVQGGLTSGRWALVHAGASGVGTAAIQLVKALGGRIVVTCSAGKVEACRALGADVVVDYGSDDFVAEVRRATDGSGVDVVLDVIGGDYVDRNVQSTRVGGRILQVGVMGGGATTVNVGALLPKRISLIGTVLRPRPIEEKIALTRRFVAEVLPRFDDRSLAPVIDSRYPLDQIGAAHVHMEANANVGKILIDVA
ncbi:MAG TPA: NAD(P)H-quinone oxidoreductase [Ilumatobacteraceae bacterium]